MSKIYERSVKEVIVNATPLVYLWQTTEYVFPNHLDTMRTAKSAIAKVEEKTVVQDKNNTTYEYE